MAHTREYWSQADLLRIPTIHHHLHVAKQVPTVIRQDTRQSAPFDVLKLSPVRSVHVDKVFQLANLRLQNPIQNAYCYFHYIKAMPTIKTLSNAINAMIMSAENKYKPSRNTPDTEATLWCFSALLKILPITKSFISAAYKIWQSILSDSEHTARWQSQLNHPLISEWNSYFYIYSSIHLCIFLISLMKSKNSFSWISEFEHGGGGGSFLYLLSPLSDALNHLLMWLRILSNIFYTTCLKLFFFMRRD